MATCDQKRGIPIVNGPSKWDVMLSLFDCMLCPDRRSGKLFPTRGVSFTYKAGSDKEQHFLMSIFSVVRQQCENGELSDERWTFCGFVLSSECCVEITDYDFEKRKGNVFTQGLF